MKNIEKDKINCLQTSYVLKENSLHRSQRNFVLIF